MTFDFKDFKQSLDIKVYKWVAVKHVLLVIPIVFIGTIPLYRFSERVKYDTSMTRAWKAVEARRLGEIERIRKELELPPDIVVPPKE